MSCDPCCGAGVPPHHPPYHGCGVGCGPCTPPPPDQCAPCYAPPGCGPCGPCPSCWNRAYKVAQHDYFHSMENYHRSLSEAYKNKAACVRSHMCDK